MSLGLNVDSAFPKSPKFFNLPKFPTCAKAKRLTKKCIMAFGQPRLCLVANIVAKKNRLFR